MRSAWILSYNTWPRVTSSHYNIVHMMLTSALLYIALTSVECLMFMIHWENENFIWRDRDGGFSQAIWRNAAFVINEEIGLITRRQQMWRKKMLRCANFVKLPWSPFCKQVCQKRSVIRRIILGWPPYLGEMRFLLSKGLKYKSRSPA